MQYLLAAQLHRSPKLPSGIAGLMGDHIPIVNDQDFPQVSEKLRGILHSARKHFLFHLVAVGGMNIGSLDQPIQSAIEDLEPFAKPNAQIVIIGPASISDETMKILISKGILIEQIDFSRELYEKVSNEFFAFEPNTMDEAVHNNSRKD